MKYIDIIIIGTGISGLYSALKIKQFSQETSFLILEKYTKKWIGGRTSNEIFYGTEIVTGAGIGRKNKDKLLYKLLHYFNLSTQEYIMKPQVSKLVNQVNGNEIMNRMRREYKKFKDQDLTFKQFATKVLGEKLYKDFIISAGYTDYENEDVFETLYYYGMEDNTSAWKAFHVPWRKLVIKLYNYIGVKHFRFSNKVTKITRVSEAPCKFLINTENEVQYMCNKVIIGSTIDTIQKLLPLHSIYNNIEGQPFLRLYAKFTKKSIPVLKDFIKGFTFVAGPLQRIIPMDADNGVYMIAYNDNNNAIALKNYLENTRENRELYEMLLEKSLGMPENSVHIIAIKDFYWPIGTHYYKPLNKHLYKSREKFIEKAQHPEQGILVVGECVSRNQGWTEGALESVDAVISKEWVKKEC
jgi:thioredoxin reductase